MTSNIAIVMPLKADSERVKGKNFRDLAGKPLYRWAMDKLLLLDDVDVFVYGDAKTWSLIDNHVKYKGVDHIEEKEASSHMDSNGFFQDIARKLPGDYKSIMYANATSPFVELSTYELCMEVYREENEFDSVLTAIPVFGRVWNNDAQSLNHNPQTCPRTQGQAPVWIESDGLWLMDVELMLRFRRRVGMCPYFCSVNEVERLDINVPADFDMAELIQMSHTRTHTGKR